MDTDMRDGRCASRLMIPAHLARLRSLALLDILSGFTLLQGDPISA